MKKNKDEFEQLDKNYLKLISNYASIKDEYVYTKQIEKAQKDSPDSARSSYTKAFEPHMSGFSIALDPSGKDIKSEEFSKILEKEGSVGFFIGGAYGFDEEMRKKADMVIRLSSLTLSHKLARTMLLEQIYRAFTIINNHPYHK